MLTKKIKIEQSNLYPDGKGGQLGDRGTINGVRILKVEEDGTAILEREIDDSMSLKLVVDEERRREIARNHTGQHILSQSIIRVCGVGTVSFHMGEDYSTIDLERNLSEKEWVESENLANKIVSESRSVKKYFVDKSEIHNLGLRKISDVKGERIRIVEIEDFDKGMCAGFHVDKTSEVMLIKILKTERVKGGLSRLYFVCGKKALADYREKNNLYNEMVSLLSNPDVMESLKSKLEELKTVKKRLNNVMKEFLTMKAKALYESSEDYKDLKIGCYSLNYSQGELRFLIQNILKFGKGIFVVYNDDYFVIGSNVVDLKKVDFDAKGGGTKDIFMGKLNMKGNEEWAKKTLENLKSYI